MYIQPQNSDRKKNDICSEDQNLLSFKLVYMLSFSRLQGRTFKLFIEKRKANLKHPHTLNLNNAITSETTLLDRLHRAFSSLKFVFAFYPPKIPLINTRIYEPRII